MSKASDKRKRRAMRKERDRREAERVANRPRVEWNVILCDLGLGILDVDKTNNARYNDASTDGQGPRAVRIR